MADLEGMLAGAMKDPRFSEILSTLKEKADSVKTVMAANSQELVSRADLLNGSMEALVSAALGLVVAIPVTVMYGSLRVRLDRTIVELEAAASRIVGYLSALKEKTR